MFVPTPRFFALFLATCGGLALVVLGLFRYGSLHPGRILYQEVLRTAAHSGQSRTATELRWRRAEPNLSAPGCALALLTFSPMSVLD
ncbi:MAG: hypothetical protein EXQ85_03410 [Alphaproteobacteria bacterium]|nr:hypothetical protein [Alphaproteobacteria bacterium]